MEITQITNNPNNGSQHVVVSRVNLIEMPGSEILNEEPEALRVNQGISLNKGILALNNLIRDLSVNSLGDYVMYEGSALT
jgi:hypothetical protein